MEGNFSGPGGNQTPDSAELDDVISDQPAVCAVLVFVYSRLVW